MSAQLPAEPGLWGRLRSSDPVGFIAAGLAIASAAIVVYAPILAYPALAASGAVLLLNLGERVPRFFLFALGALLVGYAFLGRGLAHVGAPPLYVGEMVMALGVLSVIVRLGNLRFGPFEWLLVAFMLWGLARTLPFVGTYGMDAPRDAVLWAYAAFALAIPAVLGASDRVRTVIKAYEFVIPPLLLWIPIIGLIASGVEFPKGPGSDVGIVSFKGGDMGVHLGGIAAFLVLGLYSEKSGWRWPTGLLWLLWLAGLAVIGGLTRGGFVAAGLSVLIAFAFRPSVRLLQFAGVIGFIVLVAAIANFRVDIGNSGKHISVDEMTRRITSVFGNDDEALEGTRTFRLEWWGEIFDYTFEGPYFWGGKGFGVNLASDDGFQFEEDESLRAPHNSHMTVLARMGVPGLGMWLAIQIAFGVALFLAMRQAQAAGFTRWASIDAWILIYWLAMCINASFDPYLEGPQGGIWFWSLIGFGVYVLRLQRRQIADRERALRRTQYTRARLQAKAAALRGQSA